MNLGYILSGGAPVKKRYKISASHTTAGIMTAVGADGTAGLAASGTTIATDVVGVTLDTGTYVTAQGSVGTSGSGEGVVTVIINPDAVWNARMSGATTSGALLNLTTNDVSDTTGLVIDKTGATGVGDPDPNSPTMDEGTIICVSGANKGQFRAVTSVGATTATVTVPFGNTIAVGDEFIIVPWQAMGITGNLVWTTSTFDQVRQNIAAGSVGGGMAIVDMEWDLADVASARSNSYLRFLVLDHVLTNVTI